MNACQKKEKADPLAHNPNLQRISIKFNTKMVKNSRPQYSLIESNSVISECSIISSQLSGLNTSISEFLVNNPASRIHKAPRDNLIKLKNMSAILHTITA